MNKENLSENLVHRYESAHGHFDNTHTKKYEKYEVNVLVRHSIGRVIYRPIEITEQRTCHYFDIYLLFKSNV